MSIFKKPRHSLIHRGLMVVWIILILPTILWWRDSVFWVSLMSIYAIIVSHWGAYEGAKAKEEVNKK